LYFGIPVTETLRSIPSVKEQNKALPFRSGAKGPPWNNAYAEGYHWTFSNQYSPFY